MKRARLHFLSPQGFNQLFGLAPDFAETFVGFVPVRVAPTLQVRPCLVDPPPKSEESQEVCLSLLMHGLRNGK